MSAADPSHFADALVIGAGPAGLVAATYLARYRRSVIVIDGGDSRAADIPRSHNVPGFPTGISGTRLLERLRKQAEVAGVAITEGRVASLQRCGDGFEANSAERTWRARKVLLATGSSDRSLKLPLPRWATLRGIVRWCPVCDGYESTDRRIVLMAEPDHGPAHALFLRTFTRELTLVLPLPEGTLATAERDALAEAGVAVVFADPVAIRLHRGGGGELQLDERRTLAFEVLYPMYGGRPHAQLATDLGADCMDDGRLCVTTSQETSVTGLYAAGDVAPSLNQICVAMSEAAIAATSMHNTLPPNFR